MPSTDKDVVEYMERASAIIVEEGVTPETAIIKTLNEEWIGVIIFEGNVFNGLNKLHNISIISSGEKAETMREELKQSMEQLGK